MSHPGTGRAFKREPKPTDDAHEHGGHALADLRAWSPAAGSHTPQARKA